MKSYEQMTSDVLKRRDKELKIHSKKRRVLLAVGAPCCAAAIAVSAFVGGARYYKITFGDFNVSDDNLLFQYYRYPQEQNSSAANSMETSSSAVALDNAGRPMQHNFTNPNAGHNDINVIEVGMFNTDEGVEVDVLDLDPYSMDQLYSFYGLEFDRLTKLHSSWGVQHEPLGIYKKQSSDGYSVSMSMYCTRNTLNYTTNKGARISVSAQLGKFALLAEDMATFADDKPFTPNIPKTENIYDENGNIIGSISPGYDPAKDTAKRPENDEGISVLNGYDAYIYRDSNGKFLADIKMGSRVRITAEGLSESEFLEILAEYTK